MFKLLVLLTVAALSSASDYDKFLGNWTILASSQDAAVQSNCEIFSFTKTDDKCNCNGKEIPFIRLQNEKLKQDRNFIPLFVNKLEEVGPALLSTHENCSCGDRYVIRILSDNYITIYAPTEGSAVAVLLRKEATSRADFDTFIKNLEDFASPNTTLYCDVFSS